MSLYQSNLLLEIGFDGALARARELDEYFAKNGKLIGPLHGLPVTLKDQFHIKGLGTSMGFVGWIGTFEGKKDTGKEKNVESEVVRELWSLGAVPIGKAGFPSNTARVDSMLTKRRRPLWYKHYG